MPGHGTVRLTLATMSNDASAKASREEEIAFLAMEQVLGVDIELADAGAGDRKPDGCWVYPGQERRGIVEITSPPAKALMKRWANAKRAGESQSEGGSVDLRWNELAQVCQEMFAEEWTTENFDKLRAEPADERHLYLFARGHNIGHYFYRLSDSYEDGAAEQIDDLALPEGITDVWFEGRAHRDRQQPLGLTKIWLARFQTGAGWSRDVVHIEELHLPSPNPGIADDSVPSELRRPKDRTSGCRQNSPGSSSPESTG